MVKAVEASSTKNGSTLVAPMLIGLIGTSVLFFFAGMFAAGLEASNRGYSSATGVVVALAAYVGYLALAGYFFRIGKNGLALVVAWAPIALIVLSVMLTQYLPA